MDNVIEQIKGIAIRYKIEKLVFFGSRARGDNTEVSDYDIAIFARDMSPLDKANFCAEVEEVETLKKIDLVFLEDSETDELVQNIKKDGVIIYE